MQLPVAGHFQVTSATTSRKVHTYQQLQATHHENSHTGSSYSLPVDREVSIRAVSNVAWLTVEPVVDYD